MSEYVFTIEVGYASYGFFKLLTKKFERYKYRFRINEAPNRSIPTEWGQPYKLGLTQAHLELLRFRPLSSDSLEEIGSNLAAALFQETIQRIFDTSLATVRRDNKVLRLLFSYEPGIHYLISSVPWECLFYETRAGTGVKEHLGLSPEISIARFITTGDDTYEPCKIADKLRVLGVAPNPQRCLTPLEGAAELSAVSAIADHYKDSVEFCPLPNAEWQDFVIKLSDFKPHVLFYTGHGQVEKKNSILMFQTPNGECDPIPASVFANTLRAQLPNLRVVILSACETGVSPGEHPFASTAGALIKAGIPVVIAMQSRVKEAPAREFALRFITYLLQEYSIDACVNAGRLAVLDAERESRGQETQWPVPVLYLSTRRDLIFDFSESKKIKVERQQKRHLMKEKFPRPTKLFIERPNLYKRLLEEFSVNPVTVVHGPFGSGKTQIISFFCASLINDPALKGDNDEPLFFFVKCQREWKSFDAVLKELDDQGQQLGFQGFRAILTQSTQGDYESGIKQLGALLALNRLVIVFDDYVWDGEPFRHKLFSYLATYLRNSKVYVITSTDSLPNIDAEYSVVKVEGFSEEEARRFLQADGSSDAELSKEIMETAAQVEYLPWYLKIIQAVFKGEVSHSKDEFIAELDKRLDPNQRELLQQMSVLRQPVTLRELAVMLNPADPSEYLKAAFALQSMSILSFTRQLGVELSDKIKEYYRSQLEPGQAADNHRRAAVFYERQAGERN